MSARQAFGDLIAAVESLDWLVSESDRKADDEADQAAGYAYATELLRAALDLYADADADAPRFVPFSSLQLDYHAGLRVPYRLQGGVNPDALYDFAALRGDRSYRIIGVRGSDCYLSFSLSAGTDGGWPERTAATLTDYEMTFGSDGAFEVVLSAEQPAEAQNWLRLDPDVVSIIVRQYFRGDPRAETPARLSIEATDGVRPHGPTAAAVAIERRLRAAAAFVRSTNDNFPYGDAPMNQVFRPFGYAGQAGALGTTDNVYGPGRWELDNGQALVIEGRSPECRYWSCQLWNRWGQSLLGAYLPELHDRLIVNDANVILGDDGSWRLVISERDPGVPNWLATFGYHSGTLLFRWLIAEGPPEQPQAKLVALEDLERL